MKRVPAIILACLILSFSDAQDHPLAIELDRLSFSKGSVGEEYNGNLFFNFRKKKLHWYKGSILTTRNRSFDNLYIRYNTMDGRIDVRFGEDYYKISSAQLKRFVLHGPNGEKAIFENGFNQDKEFLATIDFRGSGDIYDSINEITSVLASDSTGTIKSMSIRNRPGVVTGRIVLNAEQVFALNLLVSRINGVEGIETAELKGELPETMDFQFLQVLNNGKFRLLKMHETRVLSGNPNQLTRDVYTSFIKDQHFFVANDNMITELKLNRGSILGFLNEHLSERELDRLSLKRYNLRKERDVIRLLDTVNQLLGSPQEEKRNYTSG